MPHLQIKYAQPTVIVFNQRCVGSSPESVWRYEGSLVCMITSSETFEIERMPMLDMYGVPICAVRRGRDGATAKTLLRDSGLEIERRGRIRVIGALSLSPARTHFEGHI